MKDEKKIIEQLHKIEEEILGEGTEFKGIDSDLIISNNRSNLTNWMIIRLVLKWVLDIRIKG